MSLCIERLRNPLSSGSRDHSGEVLADAGRLAGKEEARVWRGDAPDPYLGFFSGLN